MDNRGCSLKSEEG